MYTFESEHGDSIKVQSINQSATCYISIPFSSRSRLLGEGSRSRSLHTCTFLVPSGCLRLSLSSLQAEFSRGPTKFVYACGSQWAASNLLEA